MYQSFTRTISQQWNNQKNHAQFHKLGLQTTNRQRKNATLVYGFLNDFATYTSRRRFDYGTFWWVGRFNLCLFGRFDRWDVLTWSWDVLTMGHFDRWDVLTVNLNFLQYFVCLHGRINYINWCITLRLSYVWDACKSAPEASRHLCSSGAITCVMPWSKTRLGDRSFDVAGLRLWTSCLLYCSHLTVSANSEDSWKRFCLSRTRLWRLVTLAFRRRI